MTFRGVYEFILWQFEEVVLVAGVCAILWELVILLVVAWMHDSLSWVDSIKMSS